LNWFHDNISGSISTFKEQMAKANQERTEKATPVQESDTKGTSPQQNHSAPQVALPDSAEVLGSP
jgi:hypothetical protein